jgi:hypothetical protein
VGFGVGIKLRFCRDSRKVGGQALRALTLRIIPQQVE